MSNATDLTEAFSASSGGTFVTGDEKHDPLHAQQIPMYVYHVEPKTEGQYGLQTIFHIKAQPWGRDETKLLAFSHNEYRERLAENMKILMAANPGKPGGPIYLHKFTTKSGNEAWDIKPTPQHHATPAAPKPAPSAAPQPIASAQTIDDDSLPF